MNKKILFVIALSWILVGCAYEMAGGPPAALDCELYTPAPLCAVGGASPTVTIDINAKTVVPECIKVEKEQVIIFKIMPEGSATKGSVELVPKDSADDEWLAGKNYVNKKRIYVGVPEKDKKGNPLPLGYHSYGVYTPNWCIDPRVKVEN